jgi:acetyl coenzyme A synthetase (ADP forming)-like protein
MDSIFRPQSIAIVGASANPKKLGYRVLENLRARGFKGKVYPVNPSAERILDLTAYPNASSIPVKVDLAVVVVPASVVPSVLEDCVAKGIRGAVVITSGFAEAGVEGRKIQEEIVKIAQRGKLRFVGPNCEGIFNASKNVNLTFAPKAPPNGGISFISQSGAIGANTMFRWGAERGVGFNIFASSGNEADLCSSDYLDYIGEDSATRVIMMYVEGISKGREFFDVAKRVTKKKPVVLLKGGETDAGSQAVSSHTGVLAGSSAVFNAVCKQAGITKVEDVDELFEVAMTFNSQPLPSGNNVGIVTGAGGGMGVLAVDACVKLGMGVPNYADTTRKKLQAMLPSYAPVNNPVDLTPIFDPMRLVRCTEVVLQDPGVESVISMGFGWRTDLISIESAAVNEFLKLKNYGKPLVVVSVSSKSEFETLRTLEAKGIPVFLTPKHAAHAIAALIRYKRHLIKSREADRKKLRL